MIVGAGGHAKVAADIAVLAGFSIAGFLDDVHTDRRGEAFSGATVLGGMDALQELSRTGVSRAFVAIGDCAARLATTDLVTKYGFVQPILRHPAATVAAGVGVGAGTLIAAGAVVNPGTRLGAAVIVNTAASVDHDCEIADGVHVGPGVHLGGRVSIGSGVWIGIGAVVKDGVRIGAGAIVGAGAVVLTDVAAGVVAYGVPAKPMRAV